MVSRVKFFFDPMCPWAYRASLWIRSVRHELGVDVAWRFFSLEEVNRDEGKKHPWERDWSYGWSQMRIGALLRRSGEDAVDQWYAASGAAGFERGEEYFSKDGQRSVLDGLGWSPDLVDEALADPTTNDEVYAEHRYVTDRLAGHGVPTLVFDELEPPQAFFGPVVLDPPTGDAAVRLWRLVEGWTEFQSLYEIRRPKTEHDLEAITSAFNKYYQTRPWKTVENPAP